MQEKVFSQLVFKSRSYGLLGIGFKPEFESNIFYN